MGTKSGVGNKGDYERQSRCGAEVKNEARIGEEGVGS